MQLLYKEALPLPAKLGTLAPGWIRGFSEKKRLNARGFAREILRSGML